MLAAMTDDTSDPHKTEAEKKKEEAARRLQEVLLRKQNRPHAEHHGPPGRGKNFGPHFSPKPVRRGPRGG